VVRDTPFRETHYKGVLKALEKADKTLPIDVTERRKRGTYADLKMRLFFKPKTTPSGC
jgi:hypothetical protein